MASAADDDSAALLRSLNPSQRNSLETFAAVTKRDAASRDSIEAMRESGWDVQTVRTRQAAISRVYDGAPSSGGGGSSSPSSRHAYHADEADDEQLKLDALNDPLLLSSPGSRNGSARRGSGRSQTGGLGTGAIGLYYLRQALAFPLALLAYPAALLYNFGAAIVLFLARLFRLRPSSTASFRPRNPFAGAARRRTNVSPAAAAENFVRSVERVTALSRRAVSATTTATGPSGARGASSSSGLTSRLGASHANASRRGTGPRIPDFFLGSYDEALRFARDEMRILMVVLTSEEHDRDERFKREVLVSEVVNDLVEEERIVVWGGDVSDRDAYHVGQTLSYISLPFVAFIALQPSGPPGLATNPSTAPTTSPRMRLISRLEHLPSSPLTAASLHAHVQTSVLPRAKPFLARLVAQKSQREADRRAREDAERRVAENARRDEEKVLAVRRREEERLRAERERLEREERAELERREKELEAEKARRWREWKRGELLRQQQGQANAAEEGAVTVAVRLGNGQRVMRTFAGRASTEEVYAWTECELEREADARVASSSPSCTVATQAPPDYLQRYHFRLATTFPRQVIPLPSHLASPSTAHLDQDGNVGEISVAEAFRGLGKTVNLVVDGLETRRRMSMNSREEESDEEEEDEEED
ncbi:hypothetical protein JCM10908_001781 [Rhodotorula pacifica]|uniref:clathrin-mediated endocytosis regulator UBX3 n=1 Tax=Rhodotorula pacifica TaxID=1495444 RepID=UPI003170B67E